MSTDASFKTEWPQCTLQESVVPSTNKGQTATTIYELHLHNRPDNRLTPDFIQYSILPALDEVERHWRAHAGSGDHGGAAALITYGPRDADRFYSNGLDLALAMRTPMFFPRYLNALLSRVLLYPIPTIAAINGHAFAGGFTLALAHDYRIMKATEGKGRSLLSMNEIFFGAQIPTGMMGILKAKLPPSPVVMRTVLLEGQRFGAAEALALGIVDDVAADGPGVIEKAKQLAVKFGGNAKAGAWGIIKGGMYKEAVIDMATDRGNDGLGADVLAKL